MNLMRPAEQGHINTLERYADNAGLSFTRMNTPDGRPVLVVELSKSWSLFNLACCLMESAYSSGRATEPLLNTDAVLHEGFAYLTLARHNGDDFGLTAAELGLMPPAFTAAEADEQDDDELPMAAEARDLTAENIDDALASLKREVAKAIRHAAIAGDYRVVVQGPPFNDPNSALRGALVEDLRLKGYICADSVSAVDPSVPWRTALVIGWPKLDTPVVRRQGGRLVEAPLGGKVPDSNALTYTTGQGN